MLRLVRKYKEMSPVQKARLTSTVTMVYNFVTAGAKIFFGVFSAFWFICISGLYSLCMGLCKRVYFVGRAKSEGETYREISYYRVIGSILSLAAVCYIGYMVQYVLFPSELKRYGTLTSIVIVAVSAVEVAFALTGIVRARKDRDLLMEGLKFVNLVSSLIAVVTAEAVVLTFFADLGLTGAFDPAFVNAMFGLMLGLVSLSVGIFVFVKSRRLRREFCRLNPDVCASEECDDDRPSPAPSHHGRRM